MITEYDMKHDNVQTLRDTLSSNKTLLPFVKLLVLHNHITRPAMYLSVPEDPHTSYEPRIHC